MGDDCGTKVIEDCAISLLLFFFEMENVTPKSLSSFGFGVIDLSLGKETLKVLNKILFFLTSLNYKICFQQIVRNLISKLPETVLKYLKSENSEEPVTEFGKDVKVYPIDELSENGVDMLMDWGNTASNFDGLTKKDISFKWEDSKTNDSRIFEVRLPQFTMLNFNFFKHLLCDSEKYMVVVGLNNS